MFILDNALEVCLGGWVIGFMAFIIGKKTLGYKAPAKFTTTEFKKKFKKHQLAFNEEFKTNNKLFK